MSEKVECPECGNTERFLCWQKHWRRMMVDFSDGDLQDVGDWPDYDPPEGDEKLVAFTCEECNTDIYNVKADPPERESA